MLHVRPLRVLLSLALLLVLSAAIVPRSSAAADQRCFDQTGYCISGRLRQFWEQHGGLMVFGYPVTSPRAELNRDTGQIHQTQWFERARLELHPEHRPPYDVLLGRLGDDALTQRGIDWRDEPKAAPDAPRRFAETGHAITYDPFWNYWRSHGLEFDGRRGFSMAESLALFGMPITEARAEINENGDTLLTQWFERARFEFHANNPEPYTVLLGLLGNELLGPDRLMPPAGRLAFRRDGNVHVINADGSGERRLTDLAESPVFGGLDWSPNGRSLAFVHDDRLQIVAADGSQPPRSIADAPESRPQTPRWSPDGQRIAFTRNGDVFAVSADGSRLTTISADPADEVLAGWSPDGGRVLTHAISGDPGFYVVSADGSGRVRLPSGSVDTSPAWSPDGSRIVFQSIRNMYDWDVIVTSADGSGAQAISLVGGDDVNPAWSPDSRRVAYARYSLGGDALYVVNADGTDRVRLASLGPAMIDPLAWSPDARHIALGRGGSIFVINAGSGASQVRLVERGSVPAWSPN
jgi:Tol biopolymer transport system component